MANYLCTGQWQRFIPAALMSGRSHPRAKKSMRTNKMEFFFLNVGEISKHLSAAAVMHMLACGGGRADTGRAFAAGQSIPTKHSILTAVMSHPLPSVPFQLPVSEQVPATCVLARSYLSLARRYQQPD